MGLGMQLVAWPQEFIDALVDAGFRVIRMDNRDIGLSQHFDHLGTPNLLWAGLRYKLGLPVRSPYSLSDMAADGWGVLDALHHRARPRGGVSMGGMIAQRMALAQPERMLSLTSIMSSSGARELPQARPRSPVRCSADPPATAPEVVLAHFVRLFQIIGSPDFPTPEETVARARPAGFATQLPPVGTQRQMLAIVADQGRAQALSAIRCPRPW